ncbi:hypothetical protein GQ600_11006 [Phytophthora cactorum]|nr:hypothetical protein GQ600_11006 [Phytophthora cactorum]
MSLNTDLVKLRAVHALVVATIAEQVIAFVVVQRSDTLVEKVRAVERSCSTIAVSLSTVAEPHPARAHHVPVDLFTLVRIDASSDVIEENVVEVPVETTRKHDQSSKGDQ